MLMSNKITSIFKTGFFVDTFGLYAISITARCKSGKLLGLWGGEDLHVEIDDVKLREIPSYAKPQYVDIPVAWNGTHLKGLSKTVIFLLPLNKGDHTLNFIPTHSATVETYRITPVTNPQDITLVLDDQAEDGDRRPWYTFALINLPLKALSADITVDWHFFDGDDVKLVIDGQIEQNKETKGRKDWIWHATPGQVFSGPRRANKTIEKKLPQGTHYIELWADKMPTLHKTMLDLGNYTPQRVPTVHDPQWTGDFADDTDQIILARALFGEARNTLVPDQARTAIGWIIKNRVKSERWANNYWEVITYPGHFSSFNRDDDNRPFVENPLHTQKDIDRTAWEHVYEIAGKIINDQLPDPTQGANHYYDDSISAPNWAENKKSILHITYVNALGTESTIFFYKL